MIRSKFSWRSGPTPRYKEILSLTIILQVWHVADNIFKHLDAVSLLNCEKVTWIMRQCLRPFPGVWPVAGLPHEEAGLAEMCRDIRLTYPSGIRHVGRRKLLPGRWQAHLKRAQEDLPQIRARQLEDDGLRWGSAVQCQCRKKGFHNQD